MSLQNISFQTNQLNTKKEENHPQYYNITIYRFNGFTYKKTVKTITYGEALEIEEKFKNIDQGFDNVESKTDKELEALMNYGILNKNDRDNNIQTTTTTMSSSKPLYKDFYPQPIIGGGNITAKLGPNGNIGVFTPFSAFFISMIGLIADLTFQDPGGWKHYFVTDQLYMLNLLLFSGILLILSFASMGAIIKGHVLLVMGMVYLEE